jgi:hypothetical protein
MTLVIMTAGFFILLIVRRLVQTIYQLLFKGEAREKSVISSHITADAAAQPDALPGKNALPPAQAVPVSGFVSPLRNTAEMTPLPSVTEKTTDLLDRQ